jgi:hypothetical protein
VLQINRQAWELYLAHKRKKQCCGLLSGGSGPESSFNVNADSFPDPNPVSQTNADPDHGQSLKSQKVEFC